MDNNFREGDIVDRDRPGPTNPIRGKVISTYNNKVYVEWESEEAAKARGYWPTCRNMQRGRFDVYYSELHLVHREYTKKEL